MFALKIGRRNPDLKKKPEGTLNYQVIFHFLKRQLAMYPVSNNSSFLDQTLL